MNYTNHIQNLNLNINLGKGRGSVNPISYPTSSIVTNKGEIPSVNPRGSTAPHGGIRRKKVEPGSFKLNLENISKHKYL